MAIINMKKHLHNLLLLPVLFLAFAFFLFDPTPATQLVQDSEYTWKFDGSLGKKLVYRIYPDKIPPNSYLHIQVDQPHWEIEHVVGYHDPQLTQEMAGSGPFKIGGSPSHWIGSYYNPDKHPKDYPNFDPHAPGYLVVALHSSTKAELPSQNNISLAFKKRTPIQ